MDWILNSNEVRRQPKIKTTVAFLTGKYKDHKVPLDESVPVYDSHALSRFVAVTLSSVSWLCVTNTISPSPVKHWHGSYRESYPQGKLYDDKQGVWGMWGVGESEGLCRSHVSWKYCTCRQSEWNKTYGAVWSHENVSLTSVLSLDNTEDVKIT